jgi:hypothetical protein
MQLAVSVHNPRLVVVRRFVNNVLYVSGLINREVEAASWPTGSGTVASAAAAAEAEAPLSQMPAAGAEQGGVLFLHLTNVQVGKLVAVIDVGCRHLI